MTNTPMQGQPVAIYRMSGGGYSTNLQRVLQLGCGGLALIFIALTLFTFFTQRERGWYIITCIGALIVIAWQIWVLIDQRRRGRQQVDIYENGMDYSAGGGQPRSYAWDEIESLTLRATNPYARQDDPDPLSQGALYTYWQVKARDGQVMVFDTRQWNNAGEMAGHVQRGTKEVMLPEALKLVHQGGVLQNQRGEGISREGLIQGGRLIPWSEVEGVTITKEVAQKIMYKRGGEWYRFAYVSSIPNLHIFLSVMNELGYRLEMN